MEKTHNHPSTSRDPGLVPGPASSPARTTSSDFVLQWGSRKRARGVKFQAKEEGSKKDSVKSNLVVQSQRATTRPDRRVIRSDLNHNSHKDSDPSHPDNNHTAGMGKSSTYLNLRQRPASPGHRVLRNSDNSIGMRSNGVRGLASPDRDRGGAGQKDGAARTSNGHHHPNKNNNSNNGHSRHHAGGSASSEAANEGGHHKGGSSSGSDVIPAVWPPKFVIALTNKEKEEDFLVLKGSRLPQRPKKRAKLIQRTLNLVSPGAWLCDLTLERYEVREKKVTKKRPRGLKAMGNMIDSDSE